MYIHRTSSLCALGLLMSATFTPFEDAVAQDWEPVIAAYVWGSGSSVDVYVNDEPVFDADIDLSDLVDKTDFSAQLHIEARKNRFGLLFDATYVNTGDKLTTSPGPVLPGGTELKTDTRTSLVEVGGFYRPSGDSHGLDVLYGVRAINMDIEMDVTPPGEPTTQLDTSSSLTDGFVGLRYIAPLADKWFMNLRGDVGAGDSELSWNAAAIFGYRFGKSDRYMFLFGYRHFVVELEETEQDVRFEVDLTMSGPEIGFATTF